MSSNASTTAQILAKTAAQVAAIMDNLDLGFVEAEHVDRHKSCQVWSPAQRPLNMADGESQIEHYAPKDTVALAWPTLYCITHNSEHACTHVNKADRSIGACDFAMSIIKNTGIYEPAERVSVDAKISHTGNVTR